ncbi:amidohydrolase [Bacilli bacterium PM5-3]|nr:amidohydrolase [Bacilli bacterium PM5-3]
MNTNELVKEMVTWRHHFHENPETAFEENETANYLVKILKDLGLDVHQNIGGTGIVANLKCGDGTKIIGIRSEIDAINLLETNDIEYKSKNEGKMHACGHDGHMATLLGTAKLLSEEKNFNGTVRFIFQPAEEPGKGAQAMIDDDLFKKFPVDEIYGLHNRPNYQAGKVLTRSGGIMASEDNFTIKIKGIGSHASSPHLGIDPLVIAAEIIMSLQTIVSRTINPTNPAVISCTEIHTDGAHNALPSNVVITGDTRSTTLETQEILEKRMKEVVENICTAHHAEYEFEYTHEFAPTINWEECTNALVNAARKALGDENVDGSCEPWMGSEDFGCYLNEVPGCLFFLGSDKENSAPLHNSQYDYNDDVLLVGVNIYKELVTSRLPK